MFEEAFYFVLLVAIGVAIVFLVRKSLDKLNFQPRQGQGKPQGSANWCLYFGDRN